MSHTQYRFPPLTASRIALAPAAAHHWHPLESLRQQVERLYYDFAGGMWPVHAGLFAEAPAPQPLTHALPAVDIQDKGDAYEMTAELPGLGLADIALTVANGVLSIEGSRPRPADNDRTFLVQERPRGAFERSFRLPDDVDSPRIEAAFRDGLLRVQLPKTASGREPAQKIAVKT